jgi:Glucose / Sorbosone dehydrogenase
LPSGFAEEQFSGNLSGSPTAMAFAPDGRLFVCQQGGQLRVIKTGSLLSTPFVSLTVESSGERGLLGIAFDPNFATNNYIYLYYTVSTSPNHNRVSRFTAAGDTAVPGSEAVILELDNLSSATNHNGGAIPSPAAKPVRRGLPSAPLVLRCSNSVSLIPCPIRGWRCTDANGTLLASDDNWQTHPNQAAAIASYGLVPPNNLESAIAISLAPGRYTAIVTGKNNQTGIGLIEIYDER